jgi:DNA polymerase-4
MGVEAYIRQPPAFGRAIYVDMNSFFASVEQQAHPELRGQPVGVCPFVHDATCVIAASVEAKRYGITTGTSVRVARQLCPQIQLISDDPTLYRTYHHRIMDVLGTTRCQVNVRSIDEAFLVVPSDLRAQAIPLARQLQQLVRGVGSELGCSIGIASNLFLAKLGTKLHKPYGLTAIRIEDLEALYATLALTDLYGISWRLARQLQTIGITTPLELYHAPYELLQHRFGVNGERWYLRLRGYEVDQRPTRRRSMSHQTTLAPDPATTYREVVGTASQLSYKVAARLRAAGLAATGVQVGLRFTNRTYWASGSRTATPFWDSGSLVAHSQAILRHWTHTEPVRLISVVATNLVPQQAVTRSWLESSVNSERISRALDEIDGRFGYRTIAPAIHLLGNSVADRVGFGNVAAVPGIFPKPKKVFHRPNL